MSNKNNRSNQTSLIESLQCIGLEKNPCVDYSLSLMLLAYRLSKITSIDNKNIEEIREKIINDILYMSSKLSKLRLYEELDISRHRYCLSVFIDEMVMKNDAFIQSYWANNTLSSRFFNETTGGDKFFGILYKWLENPDRNKDMLEFCYACIVLGYKGKYALNEDGDNKMIYLCENIASALTPTINSDEETAFKKAYRDFKKDTFLSRRGEDVFKYSIVVLPVLIVLIVFIISFLDINNQSRNVSSHLTNKIEMITI
ncbi:hypothetical protein BKH41_08660 [Helicobacter sp. 12S02232-10]|nr:hypothetical protein BKH41_08660 [Helicobacter sp. 12S02232-10]